MTLALAHDVEFLSEHTHRESIHIQDTARSPDRGDVHLRIWLGSTAFDYRTSLIAAANLIHDWRRKHWCSIELFLGTTEEPLPETRLPNERLFLGP